MKNRKSSRGGFFVSACAAALAMVLIAAGCAGGGGDGVEATAEIAYAIGTDAWEDLGVSSPAGEWGWIIKVTSETSETRPVYARALGNNPAAGVEV